MDPKLDTADAAGSTDNDAAHARAVAAGFDSYIEEVADRRHQLTTKGVITPAGRLSDAARSSMDPDLADLVDLLFSGGTPAIETETAEKDAPAEATPVLTVSHDDAGAPGAVSATPAAAVPAGPMPVLPPDQALEVLKDQYPTKTPEGDGAQPGQQGEGQ